MSKGKTNYGRLLKRQARLQELGRAFLQSCTREQIEVALMTELGELAQECKADWAWWKKPGDKREVNRERLLAESADVLHFCLLLDLQYDDGTYLTCLDWGDISSSGFYDSDSITKKLNTLRKYIDDWGNNGMPGYEMTDILCALLEHYGFTPDDLAEAYWQKTEENLLRWAQANTL